MALYEYKCTDEKCKVKGKPVAIQKPMSESSREEKCTCCESTLERQYGIAGHQTFGDGYKG